LAKEAEVEAADETGATEAAEEGRCKVSRM